MAEIAVNLVIDKLIPLLRDEFNVVSGVQNKVESLKNQLRLIQAYLKDADAKAETEKTSHLVEEWTTQMRQVSYRIEDVIDEYLYQANDNFQDKYMCGVASVICKICDMLRSVVSHHKTASQIDEIGEEIEKLNQAADKYGLNQSAPESNRSENIPATRRHCLLQVAPSFKEDEPVGIDETKQVLSNWLSEEGGRTVISVVGEGGLGKTTIVNKVYKQNKESKSYDCYAWIDVSQSPKGDNLLKTLLKTIREVFDKKDSVKEISKMNNDTLIRELREHLRDKNYMIVFDNVWDRQFWEYVEDALPKDKGRIIITTRDKRVAEFCRAYGPTKIHDMEPLKGDDAQKLFYLKAFPEGRPPEDLKELSQEFVKKCNGVPLAIVAIARLLLTKTMNVSEWRKVRDSLSSKLIRDPRLSSVNTVLSESYQDLDYGLKSCLLYFALFPEDYYISRVRLIHLWIAEGFVENRENPGQTLEEVAEEYLTELIDRSLVKVAEVYPYGRVRSCRVHGLMHNFILKKCDELNFCQVKKSEGFQLHKWTRRLSIDTSVDDVKTSAPDYGLVRSCFVFNIHHPDIESFFSSFKLLGRLDCEGATFLKYLPETVGDLIHLKYLNLSHTQIEEIPKSIGKLKDLETLKLKNTGVRELPQEVNKLVKLRHLVVYDVFSRFTGMKMKEGIQRLNLLEMLVMVDARDNGDVIMKELKNLKQMRNLGIIYSKREDGKLLCNAIESMTYLRSLTVVSAEGVIHLKSLSVPPSNLERLYLDGRLEKLPDWIPKLRSVVKLRLSGSALTEDPLPLLKELSTLLELQLLNSYEGEELHFREGWFPKLKALTIELPTLKTLKIEEGQMPQLQIFHLHPRPETCTLPFLILRSDLETMAKELSNLIGVFNDLIDDGFDDLIHSEE